MSDQAGSGANAGNDLANVAISFKDCTPEICPYDLSFYAYRIDLAPNAVFLALFALSLVGFLAVFAFTRRGRNFTIAMALGLICEIIGYAGRIMSWQNQWSENGFMMQICVCDIQQSPFLSLCWSCIRRDPLIELTRESLLPKSLGFRKEAITDSCCLSV